MARNDHGNKMGHGHARGPAGSVKHPGFASVSHTIAQREGVSEDRADAILAAATRRASAGAKATNPRLGRVK